MFSLKISKLNKLANAKFLENNSENICKKITAGISAIRRVKPFVDKDTLISIYNAIVRPYFDYCCEVWDALGESQSKRLQKRQNRAAGIILNMSNDVAKSFHCSTCIEVGTTQNRKEE
jgi:hypothetical protein